MKIYIYTRTILLTTEESRENSDHETRSEVETAKPHHTYYYNIIFFSAVRRTASANQRTLAPRGYLDRPISIFFRFFFVSHTLFPFPRLSFHDTPHQLHYFIYIYLRKKHTTIGRTKTGSRPCSITIHIYNMFNNNNI